MGVGSRRGGLPGPESRTGLVRPSMTEAEFERRQSASTAAEDDPTDPVEFDPPPRPQAPAPNPGPPAPSGRGRAARAKPAKPRRVQRMFALEEELDKKLWLYAIHVGKDRSEVINDLLRPVVASMVLYDSRDRRSARSSDPEPDRNGSGEVEA